MDSESLIMHLKYGIGDKMPNREAKSRKQKRHALNKKWAREGRTANQHKKWKAKNPDAQQQNRWGR